MKQKQFKCTATEFIYATHGSYMISDNSVWSHLIPEINDKVGGFSFDTGDVIELTFNKETC